MMKQKKPLTKEQYLKKFIRAVRWRLTPQESEEAIADYRELIFQEERDESRLVEELGVPAQAAHLITDVKTYLRWLAVFAVLAFGLFLQTKWLWTARGVTFNGARVWWNPVLVMVIGLPLSLYWFRSHGWKSGPLSKRLTVALAAVLAVGLVVFLFVWCIMGLGVGLNSYKSSWVAAVLSEGEVGPALSAVLMCVGTCFGVVGLAGLVLAKCSDRRWLALYTLCLTLAAMLGFVIFVMHAMDLSFGFAEHMRIYVFTHILPVGVVGLIGTGVALC